MTIATQSLDRGIQASLDCPVEPDNDRHVLARINSFATNLAPLKRR
jgi:hypothetical protein